MLEVTAPRIPCGTLAARTDDRAFAQSFTAAGRPGVYTRVIAPGKVEAGDTVVLARSRASDTSVLELARLFYDRSAPLADLERALRAPIAERARRDLERRAGRLRSEA